MFASGAEDVRPIQEAVEDMPGSESAELFAPALQLLTSACWLSLKEAGLVVGIIARCIPLLGDLPLAITVNTI